MLTVNISRLRSYEHINAMLALPSAVFIDELISVCAVL